MRRPIVKVDEESVQEAKDLMRRYPVVDALALGAASDRFIGDCIAGQVSAVNWTVGSQPDDAEAAFMKMLAMRRIAQRLSEKAVLVRTVADIHVAHDRGSVALIAGWQAAEPLDSNPEWLEVFWEYGLRIMQLCYNVENGVGYGCLEPTDHGLKRFGLETIRECNRLGIVVDLSHTGVRTTLNAIAASDQPCVFSHSNASVVHPNPRNITDEQIRACAARGGVIGTAALTPLVAASGGTRRATLDEWVRCIDYVVDLVGIDHAGIGTDISAFPASAERWNTTVKRRNPEVTGDVTFETRNVERIDSHADFPWLVAALLERGYTESDVAKVIGGNWLRVFGMVWAN